MVVEPKQINQKYHHEVELQNFHINKLNYLVQFNYSNLKEIFVNLNLKSFDNKYNNNLKRFCVVYIFLLNNSFLIHNGINCKKLTVLNFYLNRKIGEFFFTRVLFSFLKKNKKITKR